MLSVSLPQVALELERAGVGLHVREATWARETAASASARRARSFQLPPASPTSGIRPSHFSATRMWAWIQLSASLMRSSEWWWTTLKSAVTTLRPAVPHLQAEVEVVAVELPERLVEADVADRPGRQAEHEAVDGVDLAGARVGRHLVAVPGEAGQLAAAQLAVAVDERRPRHRALPPRDAAHADRADAADHADLRVAPARAGAWRRSRCRRSRRPGAASTSASRSSRSATMSRIRL